MIHEWMTSRHRLLREAAGEHMGSCSLRDLDPRGEVEGRELNCRQRQVSEWTRTSQLSTKYFSQPVPNISLNCHLQLAPSLSQRHWPHGALVAEITSGTDRVNWLRNIGPRRSFTFLRQQDRQLEAVRRGMFLSTCVYLWNNNTTRSKRISFGFPSAPQAKHSRTFLM